jgi:hypothetical protein
MGSVPLYCRFCFVAEKGFPLHQVLDQLLLVKENAEKEMLKKVNNLDTTKNDFLNRLTSK